MNPLTKDRTRQITSAKWIPTMISEDSLPRGPPRSERPGPVHLELPEDIAAMPVEHFQTWCKPHSEWSGDWPTMIPSKPQRR